MDNQHRKITGYRELTQDEINLMNEVKAKGAELEALLAKCTATDAALEDTEPPGLDADAFREAGRWRAIARTHFQEGLMALTRSVAKPAFF